MNYRNNAHRELKNMLETLPEYSLGEIFYSVLRTTEANSISDIKNLSDEEVFTAIERAIEVEAE